ncbi:hypothetical protein XI25_30805 [Paenibacillus sp. DMB20]|nr:hypothetical protein XI25_30805 [Paenibacillus sp. DMB20]
MRAAPDAKTKKGASPRSIDPGRSSFCQERVTCNHKTANDDTGSAMGPETRILQVKVTQVPLFGLNRCLWAAKRLNSGTVASKQAQIAQKAEINGTSVNE